MSVFASGIILILSMLIQAFLQLSPGLFSIFYHHGLGISTAKKTDDRALSYIIGTEIFTILIFLIIYSIVTFFILENNFLNSTFFFVMSGIFIFETIFAFFFYFKNFKKGNLELFLPRRLKNNLITRAEHIKNRSDTILLGLIPAALELILTLPLYIICSIAIFKISFRFGFIFIIIFTIVATLPLFVIRLYFRTGHNLAELTRLRMKYKFLFRFLISVSLLAIAIILLITALKLNGII